MRVILAVIFLGTLDKAEAAPYVLRPGQCSGRGTIRSQSECRQAQKHLNLKTVDKYESWVEQREFPGGFAVAGEGTEKADDNTFTYCSYFKDREGNMPHFTWCDNNGKCGFHNTREQKSVCRAYCSDVRPTCKQGEKVHPHRSGSTASECCVKDESDFAVLKKKLADCVDSETDYKGLKECAEGAVPSRLFADNIPSFETPSAVMPVFAAGAAVFAACVAAVSYRRRRQPSGEVELPLAE